MTRRRWIADEVSGDSAVLTGSHASHLVRVLRASVGQEFDIVTPEGVRAGRVVKVQEDRVEFTLGAIAPEIVMPLITLLLSVFKFDRMEWAIEKCTELGVTRIIPVIARRTETHLASAAVNRLERWQRIAKQASEQSRRAKPLAIEQPKKLKEAMEIEASWRIVLSEVEKEVMLKDLLHSDLNNVALALGPEGGWAQEELELFQKSGWIPASLGPTILRAETAAIAATAIAISELR